MKKLFYHIFQFLIYILPSKQACKLNNLRQKFMKRNIFFYYDKKKKLFKVRDNNYLIYFYGKVRGINTYSYGVETRVNSLAKSYGINLIDFYDNDVIIDCGANFGDIFTWSKIKNLKLKYISFEPSPNEFKCIKLNCENQINNQIALSNYIGESIFYIKSGSADSSLIEPLKYTQKIKVLTTTLNDYVKKNNINKIKLLKLEAEGAEPEILMGAEEVLHQIQYIAADGGPERGIKQETTINYILNFLEKKNFKKIFFESNKMHIRTLFKNNKF